MADPNHREHNPTAAEVGEPIIDSQPTPMEPAPNRRVFLGAAAALIAAAGGAVWVATKADPEEIEAAAFDDPEPTPTTAAVAASAAASQGGAEATPPPPPEPLPLKTYELRTPLADPPFEPEPDTEWWNSEPLTAADLEGKVVLFDFWTFGCINCRNTIPSLKAWYERYADDGLIVLGVHTAEFNFEKEPGNIEDAIADLGIQWPVVNDPNKKVWRAFNTRFWPTKAIYDTTGTLRYAKKGEGRYREVEDYIRDVLEVDPASPRSNDPEQV